MDNDADLEDLNDEVRKDLTVHLVEDLDRVIEIALRPDTKARAKPRAKPRKKTRSEDELPASKGP